MDPFDEPPKTEASLDPNSVGCRFQPESHLERDLKVLDRAVIEMPTDLLNLEPVQFSYGLRSACYSVADRRVHAVWRTSHNLDDTVDVIVHSGPLPMSARMSSVLAAARSGGYTWRSVRRSAPNAMRRNHSSHFTPEASEWSRSLNRAMGKSFSMRADRDVRACG